MNAELQRISSLIERAFIPEEVFGELSGETKVQLSQLKQAYRQLARSTHPDGYTSPAEQALTQQAFARLGDWLAQAEGKIRAGLYGEGTAGILLRSKVHDYIVSTAFSEDMLYQRHPCQYTEKSRTHLAELCLTRDPRNNDLADNEAQLLRQIAPVHHPHKFSSYFPNLLDSFLLEEAGMQRQANVFARSTGWYTLAEVRAEYPAGIDPKDMAWIWRRLLVALGFTHTQGIVHGAVLPGNIAILPAEHGLRLDQWAFAARLSEDTCITRFEASCYDWYPEELLNREPPTPGADIFLAARCMMYALGADPIHPQFPAAVPRPIQAFLKGCTLAAKRSRPQDAWALKEEFDELLHHLWGERKFHPFSMQPAPRVF
jgi:hypothetical protein